MYRGGPLSGLVRALTSMTLWRIASVMLSRRRATSLRVRGRKSGNVIDVPVTIADVDGERYVVSMFGDDANWVRNVRHAGGHAALKSGGIEQVLLVEVPAAERVPILRRYLEVSPGLRVNLVIETDADLAEIDDLADAFPVFRIVSLSDEIASVT